MSTSLPVGVPGLGGGPRLQMVSPQQQQQQQQVRILQQQQQQQQQQQVRILQQQQQVRILQQQQQPQQVRLPTDPGRGDGVHLMKGETQDSFGITCGMWVDTWSIHGISNS